VLAATEAGLLLTYPADGTPQGPQDWESYLVVDDPGLGQQVSALRFADRIYVAYLNASANPCFAVSTAFPPLSASDWTTMLIDEASQTALPISLALGNGDKPMLAYSDRDDTNTSSVLRFAYSDLAVPLSGADWHSMEVHAEVGMWSGASASLTLIESRPTIVSYDEKQDPDSRALILCKAMLLEPKTTLDWDVCQLAGGLTGFNKGHISSLRLSNGCLAGTYSDEAGGNINIHYFYQVQHPD
jgi:hypothetical protein